MAANPYSYSTTAASNTTIDGVSIATGMDPGKVDDALRQATAGMATIIGDLGGVTAGGTANAITLTAKANFSTLANGLIVSFRATNDNTGATTLNVNSTGAKSVRKMTTAGDAALVGAEIQADGVYLAHYSAAANSSSGGWILVNPTPALTDLVSLSDLPWLSKPIGEPFPLMTDLSAAPPANNSSLYRFIILTAGLTGSGQYNEGVLTSESTSGSAPLVQATATISLSGSPLNGQTVRLINTEERFLRAAASPGTAQADAFQGHYHDPLAPLTSFVGGRTSGTIIGSGINFGNLSTTGSPSSDGTNGTPRTANETRSKNLGVKFFLRIK